MSYARKIAVISGMVVLCMLRCTGMSSVLCFGCLTGQGFHFCFVNAPFSGFPKVGEP